MHGSQTYGLPLWVGTTAALIAGVFFVGGGAPTPVRPLVAQAGRPALWRHGPIKINHQRDDGQYDSTNWSGYAVTSTSGGSLPNGSVTDVKGSWVVPVATCSTSMADTNGYAAFWVGIDGWSSKTVEQIGTDSDCVSESGQKSTPTYYAWFEFYPKASYYIECSSLVNGRTVVQPCPVTPGDVITAEVSAAASTGTSTPTPKFTVTISDKGETPWTFSTTSSVPNAQQSSAEWIAEAPCCEKGGSVYPLADFTMISFPSGYATLSGGQSTPITGFGSLLQQTIMIGENPPNATMAQPFTIQPSSTGAFAVSWVSAGP